MQSAAAAQIPTLTPPRNSSCHNARNMIPTDNVSDLSYNAETLIDWTSHPWIRPIDAADRLVCGGEAVTSSAERPKFLRDEFRTSLARSGGSAAFGQA